MRVKTNEDRIIELFMKAPLDDARKSFQLAKSILKGREDSVSAKTAKVVAKRRKPRVVKTMTQSGTGTLTKNVEVASV